MARHFLYQPFGELDQSCEDLGASHVAVEHDPQRVKEALRRQVDMGHSARAIRLRSIRWGAAAELVCLLDGRAGFQLSGS